MKPPFWLVLLLVLSFVVRAEEGTQGAARLLPPETVIFGEFHDLPRTIERFRNTCWAELARETEVRDFFKNFAALAEKQVPAEARGILETVAKTGPHAGFFALTEMPGPGMTQMPKVILGISYRGEEQHAQALLEKFRLAILTDSRAKVKSSKESAEGAEIETFSDDKLSLSVVHADKWILMATDRQLMLDALARKAGHGAESLAQTDAWKTAAKEAVAEPDMTGFIAYGSMMKKLSEAGGADAAALSAFLSFLPEFISVSTKFDGLLMRERAYAHFKMVLPRAESKHRSLAFTGEDTYAYLETNVATAVAAVEKIAEVEPSIKDSGEFAQFGLSFEDIAKTFGSELVIASDWESGALSLPTLFAAVELKDAEKGRKFAGMITNAMGTEGEVTKKDYHGTMLWSLKVPIPFFQPTIAVTDTHLMFGINQDSVTTALDHMKEAKPVAGTAPFITALKTVADTNDGLAYVNCRKLVERLYDRVRPFVTDAIAHNPKLAENFDVSLLPKAATLMRNMPSFIAGFHAGEHGYVIESTGPVTYLSGVGGVAFIGGFFTTMRVQRHAARAAAEAAEEAARAAKDR
jgi:hypothetical protein